MDKLPFLDERLLLIAGLVRRGKIVADIGSDHGYLVTWLVKNGISPSGYACDVNEQPLERSRRTVQSYGVADRVTLRIGSGLEPLHPSEVQDIIIAGMGGDLIARILSAVNWRDTQQHYLLQPMTRADELRRYLCASGYEIMAEHAAKANRFLYTVLSVRYTGVPTSCTELFSLVGKLPQCATEEARAYIRRQAAVLQKRIQGLEQSADRAAQAVPLRRLRQDILQTIGEEQT